MRRYLAIAVIVIAASCTNSETKTVTLKDTAASAADSTSIAAVKLKNDTVQTIYDGYQSLKNALVATNYKEAQAAASTLKSSLATFKGCESTAVTAGKIAEAKDITAQRAAFTSLSADLIAMFKHADLEQGVIYVQHCPMANKGEGGDWLASAKNIQNPYYGDEMMECGAVVEEIKATK